MIDECINFVFKAHTQSTNTNNNFIDKTEYYCWYADNTVKISIINALSIGCYRGGGLADYETGDLFFTFVNL